MRDKDAQLMMEAYNEADQRPPHNAYPAHWPLSHRGPDQLAAHQELQRTGHKQDPNRYNPINPKNNQPFEGFWAKHDKHDGNTSYWETDHDPTEPDGTLFKVERIGEWPNWKVTKVNER